MIRNVLFATKLTVDVERRQSLIPLLKIIFSRSKTFNCFIRAIDCIFYKFSTVINQLEMSRENEKKLFKSLVSEALPRVPLTFLVGLLWRETQRKWDLRGHNVSVATNKLDYCVRK